MREKHQYIIITFHTTSEAMAMEKLCTHMGIPGRLIPVPREITAGCGLSWRVKKEDFSLYQEKMKDLEVEHDQVVELML